MPTLGIRVLPSGFYAGVLWIIWLRRTFDWQHQTFCAFENLWLTLNQLKKYLPPDLSCRLGFLWVQCSRGKGLFVVFAEFCLIFKLSCLYEPLPFLCTLIFFRNRNSEWLFWWRKTPGAFHSSDIFLKLSVSLLVLGDMTILWRPYKSVYCTISLVSPLSFLT